MYYLWSLVASALLFSVIQFNEYNKMVDKRMYSPFTLANSGTFLILYIIITIIMYMVTGDTMKDGKNSFVKTTMKGGADKIKSVSVDPNMLRKISDNVYTGFSPSMRSDL